MVKRVSCYSVYVTPSGPWRYLSLCRCLGLIFTKETNMSLAQVLTFCLILVMSLNTFASDIKQQMAQKQSEIEQITLSIKEANKSKDKAQATLLREQREALKAELRALQQREKDQQKEQEKINKRAAAEREWETYPNDRKLCTAIQYNRPDLVKKVLDTHQLDLSQPIGECLFPLADAGNRGHKDIVTILLQHQSPLVMRIPTFNVLMSAIDSTAASKEDRTDILNILKAHGSTVHDSVDGNLVVGIMAEGDDASHRFMKEKFNIDTQGMKLGSSLFRSLKDGHINNVAWLLANGSNPNEKSLGTPALFEAVSSRDLEKVKLLIDQGADVNAFGLNHASVRKFTDTKVEKAKGARREQYQAILDYLIARGATYSDKER